MSKPFTMIAAYMNVYAREAISIVEKKTAKNSSLKSYASPVSQQGSLGIKLNFGREVDPGTRSTRKGLSPEQVDEHRKKGCVLSVMRNFYMGTSAVSRSL